MIYDKDSSANIYKLCSLINDSCLMANVCLYNLLANDLRMSMSTHMELKKIVLKTVKNVSSFMSLEYTG